MSRRVGVVEIGIVIAVVVIGIVGSGCSSTPKVRILERCSLCDTAVVGNFCPKCGVTAYEPVFLSVDEENAAQKKALEQLATMPDGVDVFVSTSPIHKPSWTMGGVIRIQEATGRAVAIGNGSGVTESDARTAAETQARGQLTGHVLPMQFYVEKVLTLRERIPRLTFRAYVLSFGEPTPTKPIDQ